MERVVITGMGAVTPLGLDMPSSWRALRQARSGLGPCPRLRGLRWPVAGEITGLDLPARFGQKECMRHDRFVLLAMMAAQEAASDAGLTQEALREAGVVMGSSRGGISTLEDAVSSRASAFLMSGTTISMAASRVSEMLGAGGHVLGISNACASGANAIGEAAGLIRAGRLRLAFAGGAEAPLTPLCVRGYAASRALSRTGSMRPFDRRRDGFVLAEGASVLVLEEYGSALGRGATIYAELAGYGNTSDAHHPTAPLAEGQARAIRAALKEAGIEPSEVDCISAHATSTPLGDRTEAEAISEVFGERAVPAAALKSMTGHMLAASGAFEAAAAAMCLREGVALPTINSEDPEFAIDISPSERAMELGSAICHSFGFGGVNAVLALRRA